MKKIFLLLSLCIALNAHDFNFQQLINQGKLEVQKGQHDQALDTFKKAMNIKPSEYSACMELGNCLLQLGNHFFAIHETAKAVDTFTTILTIAPTIGAAHHNIAFTLAEQEGNFTKALEHYQQVLLYNPTAIETHFCMSLSYLALGNFEQGFKEYEYRWQRVNDKPRNVHYPLPKLWHGNEPLHNKKICIRAEQGLGDTLQFIRYAKLLKQQGAYIIAEVQQPLAVLLSLCEYLDEIIVIGHPLPVFDYQIPLLNLPLACNTTLETIPNGIPYLRANPQLVYDWQAHFCHDTTFKIGICWQGDPAHGPSKYLPLVYFERLAYLPNITVYSLQKNNTAISQTVKSQSPINFFAHDIDTIHGSFMDTAAIMKHMDLIITVDTSIAHLAGALGVPTWVILPFPAEWRWLTARSDSPWYPTMRLFRQKKYEQWEPVFEELLIALASITEQKKICPIAKN